MNLDTSTVKNLAIGARLGLRLLWLDSHLRDSEGLSEIQIHDLIIREIEAGTGAVGSEQINPIAGKISRAVVETGRETR